MAVGTESVNSLVKELQKKEIPFFIIGDAKEPKNCFDAIHEGFEVGLKV